jgi:nicotinic acid phosphoribosyltransferase
MRRKREREKKNQLYNISNDLFYFIFFVRKRLVQHRHPQNADSPKLLRVLQFGSRRPHHWPHRTGLRSVHVGGVCAGVDEQRCGHQWLGAGQRYGAI